MTDAYTAVANGQVKLTPSIRKRLGINSGETLTGAQLIAVGQFLAAIKGKTEAAREIADRVEGKVPQPTAMAGADGELLDPVATMADLYALGEIARARLRSG